MEDIIRSVQNYTHFKTYALIIHDAEYQSTDVRSILICQTNQKENAFHSFLKQSKIFYNHIITRIVADLLFCLDQIDKKWNESDQSKIIPKITEFLKNKPSTEIIFDPSVFLEQVISKWQNHDQFDISEILASVIRIKLGITVTDYPDLEEAFQINDYTEWTYYDIENTTERVDKLSQQLQLKDFENYLETETWMTLFDDPQKMNQHLSNEDMLLSELSEFSFQPLDFH